MQADLQSRSQLLDELADGAREIALRYFQRNDLGIEWKSDESPVTQADHAIEQFLRETIQSRFPQDALLGEEYGAQAGTSGFRWILDPIDGTVSFASGVPLFGVLIGLAFQQGADREEVLAGVAEFPALGERVIAVRGQGARWMRNGRATELARVRSCASVRDALVCTSGSEYYIKASKVEAFLHLAQSCRRIRGWSDCYGFLLVATGRADAAVDPIMHSWDIGPFAVILPEAGGVLIDWSGSAGIDGGNAIAASPALAAELQALLRR
ncbi:MAG: histidinol phosphate phosphatase [Phycisphaerales bacterium]|nr:histidinol phosphate phosphatase [Phycisphaerales bacterium]